MKKRLLLVVVALLSLTSCTKYNFHRQWHGTYHYVCKTSHWSGPAGQYYHDTTYYSEGELLVSGVKGSKDVFIALLPDSSHTWQCALTADMELNLVDSEIDYRGFGGCFISPDSLYFFCSNYSPGGGYNEEYSCKKQ